MIKSPISKQKMTLNVTTKCVSETSAGRFWCVSGLPKPTVPIRGCGSFTEAQWF